MSSVQVYQSGNHRYVRIIESYRIPGEKNPRIRVLRNLGREDDLEAQEPGIVARLKREHQASRQADLTAKQDYALESIKSLLEQRPDASAEGFPLVNYGVNAYQSLWSELKLDYFFDYRQKKDSKIAFKVKNLTSLLVYNRLLNPSSKKKAFELQEQFLTPGSEHLEEIYRVLPFLAKQKENLEKHLNKQLGLQMNRSLSVAFYDVTTYYFESVKGDALKTFGYSKDNKVNQVQVVMGLLIDEQGIPISYELFPGNTNDFRTLEPVMKHLKEHYGIHKIIITADRGLNSKHNLAFLKSMGYEYVMAYKIRSSSQNIKDLVLDEGSYTKESENFKWKVCEYVTNVKYGGTQVELSDKMLITWSASRAAKDERDRSRLVEKSKKLVGSKASLAAEMKKGGKKYVQLRFLEENPVRFNQKQLEIDEQFDGYYGIQYSDPTLDPTRVLEIYHGLWKIEESFRVLKTNLEARPIHVWTEASIKGHFLVCYLSLVLQRYLEHKLRQAGLMLSTERIQDALRSAKVTIIEHSGDKTKYYIKNQGTSDLEQIFEALDLPRIPQYGRVKELAR